MTKVTGKQETAVAALVKVNPSEYGVDVTRAAELTLGLIPILEQRNLLIERFNEVKKLPITPENIEKFRRLRIEFRDNRTKGINKWHEKAKEVPLRLGQLIDAIKKSENQTNETHEEFLENGEKHYENLERERIAKLQSEREAELSPYVDNVSIFPLGSMSEEAYQQLLNGQKLAKQAAIEAEKKAEELRLENERIEALALKREKIVAPVYVYFEVPAMQMLGKLSEEEFQEKLKAANDSKAEFDIAQEEIRKENKRLTDEAEAKEKELQKEREAADKLLKEQQAEENRKFMAERAEKEKLQKELEAKRQAELKAQQEAEAKAEAEAAKGDSEKYQDFINDFELLKKKEYKFKSKKFKTAYQSGIDLIDKTITFLIGKQ